MIQASEYIKKQINGIVPPTAIILGSGLGRLADSIENPIVIPYSTIPHFPQSTVMGHKGNLICGSLDGQPVLAMQGRVHYYEGYTMQQVTFPIRVFSLLGVKRLVVSNAAGAVNPTFRVGDLMVITDHINMMPNPLIGPNDEQFGVRFPDMTTTYSKTLREKAHRCAASEGIELRDGVYLGNTGPSFETPAEYRFYRTIGADAVGMSTVPEVIVARHCGMEIFGISVISNQSNDLSENCLNDGQDVVVAADKAAESLTRLIRDLLKENNGRAL